MATSALRSRAHELGLDEDQAAAWEDRVDPDVVDAVLADLIRFEDALQELSR